MLQALRDFYAAAQKETMIMKRTARELYDSEILETSLTVDRIYGTRWEDWSEKCNVPIPSRWMSK